MNSAKPCPNLQLFEPYIDLYLTWIQTLNFNEKVLGWSDPTRAGKQAETGTQTFYFIFNMHLSCQKLQVSCSDII